MSEFSKPFLNTTMDYPQNQFDDLNLMEMPNDGLQKGYEKMGISQKYPGIKVYYAPNTQRPGWYVIYAVNQTGGRRKSRKSRKSKKSKKSRKSRKHRKRTHRRR